MSALEETILLKPVVAAERRRIRERSCADSPAPAGVVASLQIDAVQVCQHPRHSPSIVDLPVHARDSDDGTGGPRQRLPARQRHLPGHCAPTRRRARRRAPRRSARPARGGFAPDRCGPPLSQRSPCCVARQNNLSFARYFFFAARPGTERVTAGASPPAAPAFCLAQRAFWASDMRLRAAADRFRRRPVGRSVSLSAATIRLVDAGPRLPRSSGKAARMALVSSVISLKRCSAPLTAHSRISNFATRPP